MRTGFADLVIAAAVAGAALVVYGALRFPASVAAAPGSFLASAAALVLYASAGLYARRVEDNGIRRVFRLGSGLGLSIATVGIANHAIEVLTPLSGAAGALLGAGMWGLMFVSFSIACSTISLEFGSVTLGLLSSVWCGLVYAALLVGSA